MEFRDLKRQYQVLKDEIDEAISQVIKKSNFISGEQVAELENKLASYVGTKYCVSCANGTDALLLALKVWNIGENDAVFVPDFTFFSSGEVVAQLGATPVFVDICEDTFNLDIHSLKEAVELVLQEGKLVPKAIIAVDLFGLPANYREIREIAQTYNLKILEDGAQGFGGKIEGSDKRACAYGDISTTSFFPAKPLGCYGDGGAIFTDNEQWASLMQSLRVHGKGEDKYDNIRIGMNSRLDTIQAAILQVKLKALQEYELIHINQSADYYSKQWDKINKELGECDIKYPKIPNGFYSSWAQYTILLKEETIRNELQIYLKERGIPSLVYYKKPMHLQKAFENRQFTAVSCSVTENVCRRVLSIPIHPYIEQEEQDKVIATVRNYLIR